MGSPAILFGHLKNSLFLIFSRTWCIGSWNTALTVCTSADSNCPAKSFFGWLLLLNQSNLKSLLSRGIIFALPLPNYWSFSTLLYLLIRSMSWRKLVIGFPVRDFLKPCLVGRLLLKVLMATSSKLPFISLYISQYLFEYAFKVSPSRMDKDNRESKGRWTLLYVMKWEPKAWVSWLKETMGLASSHQTISSLLVLGWTEILCTSKSRLWNRRPSSG